MVTMLYRYQGWLICACGVSAFIIFGLIPVSGKYFFNCGEVLPAVRLAFSAQHELEGGHFPLQFANDYAVALQSVFLYYTPGFLWARRHDPDGVRAGPTHSLLIVTALIAASAATGTYATIRLLNGDPIPSGIASGALPFMPYFATDILSVARLPSCRRGPLSHG